jgi:hypothetical protein
MKGLIMLDAVKKIKIGYVFLAMAFFFSLNIKAQDKNRWPNGLPDDPSFFPLAVWLQNPKDAPKYKALGVNVYMALWKGPTEEQLRQLMEAEMPVICELNETAKKHLNNPIIVGWQHKDEPDNAQPLGEGRYSPCIDPQEIINHYHEIKKIDATRPVVINLGVGVSYHAYRGRGGKCGGDTSMYREYCEGADIAGYDIYPVAGPPSMRVKDQLHYVPYGIDNLRRWTHYQKGVWMAIETARIRERGSTPKPYQIEAEVWMAIIRGAKGITYFCHSFYPELNPNALLDDPIISKAIQQLNEKITQLAPVINSPSIEGAVTYEKRPFGQAIDFMVKKYKDAYYIFAAEKYGERFSASFKINDSIIKGKTIEVLSEDRTIQIRQGRFTDTFLQKGGYDVHIYKITN